MKDGGLRVRIQLVLVVPSDSRLILQQGRILRSTFVAALAMARLVVSAHNFVRRHFRVVVATSHVAVYVAKVVWVARRILLDELEVLKFAAEEISLSAEDAKM